MNAVGLLLVGGAGLAWTQYREFDLFRDALTFKLQKVQLNTAGTNQAQISFTAELVINNPRNYSVTAQGAQLILAYGNKAIATVYRATPFTIKPNGTTNVQVTFNIPYATGIPAVVQLFTNFFSQLTLTLNIAGKIRFLLGDINFQTPFKLL